MTFEEAKKILEKEGYCLIKVSKGFEFSELPVMKKQEVIEATRVVNENSFAVSMTEAERIDRQERLKKEYEKNTKAPNPAKSRIKGNFPGNKSIEYCGDSMPGPGEEQPKEGNPALKEAASQFNDALLDEQAKKIKRLGKEISKLNSIIHDKNAVLSDVEEELRLTKIREKNLAELGLKYVGENEKLKKELADKVVDKIDAQALKSAESALAYKEKVISDLTKKLNVKHKKYVYYNGTIVAVQRLVNTLAGYAAKRYYKELCDQMVGTDIAEEGADLSGVFVLCGKDYIDALKKAKDVWQE